jgi:uncharacterized membrane protein (UPF0182 family)
MIDIPEVFRRGMEEWEEGGGGRGEGGPGGDGGGGGGSFRPWWLNRRFWLLGGIFLLILSFGWIVETFTEWLWFRELDFAGVWLRSWGAEVITFVVFFLIAAAFLLINLLQARKLALRAPGVGLNLLRLPGLRGLIIGTALFLAFLFAISASSRWDMFLRFFYRVPFGAVDPIFGQDISFYLFTLPVFRFLQGWLTPLILLTLISVIALHAVNNLDMLQRGLWRPQDVPTLRRHLAILLAFALAVWAVGYRLDMFELLYAGDGVVYGPTYTDYTVRRPALTIQIALAALTALAALYNYFRYDPRPLIGAGAALVGTILIGGSLIPGIVQNYVVEPNEFAVEEPYITHNIELTRLGFGLNELEERPFNQLGELSEQDLSDSTELENVRVWDYRPLQATYAQLQGLRPYYEFSSIDVDRYTFPDGTTRQVMLAARELNPAGLSDTSWVNRRLVFTHGYGIVMNPVDKVTPEGAPEFFIRDLPPQSSIPLDVTRPEIYYGELHGDMVLVNTEQAEFNYPSGSENVYAKYEGNGGVQLDSGLRRLAFALRFRDTNLLLSRSLTDESRIMFHRTIRERVERITPFLSFDRDPYIVIADGRLVWMLDGYTVSRDFPYSTPSAGGLNYIRNAVKVTIDAYNGDVNFYIADPDDPLIQSYDQLFPNLFQPMEAMPPTLMAHIRYPEDLFRLQTQQYLTYHMTNPQTFYNKEDRWEIPQELFEGGPQAMEPYYVTFSLPGSNEPEYLLIQPYTPAGKENMIAWIAARNDPPNYGQLVVYELPKQELVFGPSQIEARIDQDPEISEQISLWDQLGSQVIRGNLIVIPLNNSFLYVEPLYLRSENSALPELKRVIVASGGRIAMRNTLDQALAALLEAAPTAVPVADVPAADVTESDQTPIEENEATPTPRPAVSGTVEELVDAANAHFEAAEAAQRLGDWTTYGQELDALRETLLELEDLTR